MLLFCFFYLGMVFLHICLIFLVLSAFLCVAYWCCETREWMCVCGGGGRWVGGWLSGCGCTSAGVCLLSYPECHAQAPYFLRDLWLHHIFRHYLINGTILGKKSLDMKCVSWLFLQLLLEKILILRIIQRGTVTNFETSSYKVHGIFVGF
jgi:hypothetical protein